MITVAIGGMSVPVDKASEGWINQMVEEARKRNLALCIRVSVQTPEANVSLATPGCGQGGGGGRAPNRKEQQIFEAWRRRGLEQGTVHPGDLRAFLADVGRIV